MKWLPVLVLCLLAFVTSAETTRRQRSDAIVCLLNSRSSSDCASYEKAAEQIAAEAAKGYPLQQFVMAVLAHDNHEVPAMRLTNEARHRYLKASRQRLLTLAEKTNNGLAWYVLSLEKNDIKLLRRAVACQNVQALNALGIIILSDTRASDALRARALDYFRQAAEQHDPNGLFNFGNCLMTGVAGEKNPEKAFTYLLEAAELGNPVAMDSVAVFYDRGLGGVKADANKALLWQMRSRAAQGNQAAADWLEENHLK